MTMTPLAQADFFISLMNRNLFLNSLILAVYAAGKKVHVHCHDAADQTAGGSVTAAHRLHRIIALKN